MLEQKSDDLNLPTTFASIQCQIIPLETANVYSSIVLFDFSGNFDAVIPAVISGRPESEISVICNVGVLKVELNLCEPDSCSHLPCL